MDSKSAPSEKKKPVHTFPYFLKIKFCLRQNVSRVTLHANGSHGMPYNPLLNIDSLHVQLFLDGNNSGCQTVVFSPIMHEHSFHETDFLLIMAEEVMDFLRKLWVERHVPFWSQFCCMIYSKEMSNTLLGLAKMWSNVSSQITLTADELICHRICATYDIEMILGRFGPWEVPHTFLHAEPPEDQICQASFQYHKLHRFYWKSAHQLLRSFEMTQMTFKCLNVEYYFYMDLQMILSDDQRASRLKICQTCPLWPTVFAKPNCIVLADGQYGKKGQCWYKCRSQEERNPHSLNLVKWMK